MRTGYAWDPVLLGHKTTSVNPEHPDRARVLALDAMMADVPGLRAVRIDPHLGFPGVLRVHPTSYVTEVREAFLQGRRALDGGDTLLASDTFEVALRSAATALSVTEAVLAGKLDNGFAAVRPPGHHALTNRGRGFCVFNNAALCARFAQATHSIRRVLVVDWDVHPADGTMSIFYDDPTVHVLSLHQDGILGRSVGSADQRGRGAGEGATSNVPLPERTKPTAYLAAFERALDGAASRCRPDLVIISCGFDAHAGDPIGKLSLEDETYVHLTRAAKRVAKDHCQGRLVSVLEGGYQLDILRRCTRAHVEALLD
jgi:acetoin utilization deacetylase AcuC-like enzyme